MILFVEYLRSSNEMYFALCMKNDLFQILPRQMLYLYGWTFGLGNHLQYSVHVLVCCY